GCAGAGVVAHLAPLVERNVQVGAHEHPEPAQRRRIEARKGLLTANQARSFWFVRRRAGKATVTDADSGPRGRTSRGVSQWLQRITTDTVPARDTPSVWLHTGQR